MERKRKRKQLGDAPADEEDPHPSISQKKRKHQQEQVTVSEPTTVIGGNEEPLEADQAMEEPINHSDVKKKTTDPLKPIGKSWLPHVANLILARCLQQMSPTVESLESLTTADIDWVKGAESLLSADDLRTIICYLSKEFPSPEALSTAREQTQQYQETNDLYSRLKCKIERPKPPLSSYFHFKKSKINNLKRKHPNLNTIELNKKLSVKWKSLSENRKGKYIERYKRDKEVYERELEQYYLDNPKALPKSKQKRNRQVTDDKEAMERWKELEDLLPSHPTTSYFLYCALKRQSLTAELGHLSSQQITKELSDRWKNLSEKKKEKYHQSYLKSKEAYSEQMDQLYKEQPEIFTEMAELKEKITSKKVLRKIDSLLKVKNGEPKKERGKKEKDVKRKTESSECHNEEDEKGAMDRWNKIQESLPSSPLPAFFVYCKAKRSSVVAKQFHLSSQEVSRVLGEKWKKLSEEKKEKYKMSYSTSKEVYSKKMEAFYKDHRDIVTEIVELKGKIKNKRVSKKIESVLEQFRMKNSEAEAKEQTEEGSGHQIEVVSESETDDGDESICVEGSGNEGSRDQQHDSEEGSDDGDEEGSDDGENESGNEDGSGDIEGSGDVTGSDEGSDDDKGSGNDDISGDDEGSDDDERSDEDDEGSETS